MADLLRARIKERLRPYYLRWVYFQAFPHARPAEFSECWQFPCFPLETRELAGRLSAASPGPAFLFYPMADIHARIQRTQHLALTLAAAGHLSFLLNPHLGRQFPRVYFRDPISKFGLLAPRLAELHIRLQTEPVYHARLLSSSESSRLADAIAALSGFAGNGIQQILSLPTWLDAALLLRARFGWPIVYDCHDLIAGFRGVSSDIVDAESRMLAEADLVLFSSEHLRDQHVKRFENIAGKSAILRNAVDPQHFRGVFEKRQSRAPTGIAGYFGALDEWFDIEAIRACAKRFPERRFQLIGRVEYEPIRSLAQCPNVEFLGEVSYDKLPELAAQFDVALIPFRVTPLTRATNPIKLYEYFICGLPVVSSRLPEVELFQDLVYLADRPEDFPDCLARAFEENCADRPARRIEAALRETWTARAAQLLDAVADRTPR